MKNYSIKFLKDENPILWKSIADRCYRVNGCCMLVHREMGPMLNEYIYQEALACALGDANIPYQKEYCFSVNFLGHQLTHRHYLDFLCNNEIILECKAIDQLGNEQRQQLWNYMRLTKKNIGILWNFAPARDQSEHYYLDSTTEQMYLF